MGSTNFLYPLPLCRQWSLSTGLTDHDRFLIVNDSSLVDIALSHGTLGSLYNTDNITVEFNGVMLPFLFACLLLAVQNAKSRFFFFLFFFFFLAQKPYINNRPWDNIWNTQNFWSYAVDPHGRVSRAPWAWAMENENGAGVMATA